MQDLDACDGVDTTTSPTTITATRMGRSVGLNTAAAEIARASDQSKNFKSAKVVNNSDAMWHQRRRWRAACRLTRDRRPDRGRAGQPCGASPQSTASCSQVLWKT